MDFEERDLRASADLLDGVELTGSGSVGSRLWSQPSINAIGIYTVSIAESSNVLHPGASAKLSMRIVPWTAPVKKLDALVRHLEEHVPWGAKIEIERTKEAPPFRAETDGPGYASARRALTAAYGIEPGEAVRADPSRCCTPSRMPRRTPSSSSGAPKMSRRAASIHPTSLDPAEIEALIVAQVLLIAYLAESRG